MSKGWTPAHGKSLVCVHWLDADASEPTRAYYEDEIKTAHSSTPVETYGLLLVDDESGVTLMNETYEDGKRVYRGRTYIPRAMIKKVEIIREPYKTKPSAAPQETLQT